MNSGAKANHDKAAEIALSITRMRSEGLSYKEVAKVLGLSPASVKQRAYRARKYDAKNSNDDKS